MKVRAGTSGYAFKEWKGTFYPGDVKDAGMLGYYCSRFPTVEINNTFYRLPKEQVLLDWAAQAPDDFKFSIKASQRITHFARLKAECSDTVEYLMKVTSALGEKLGPILFQLPPNMKKDVERLRVFLDMLPLDRKFTIEFRHDSWFEEEVYDLLRARDIAMCVIDQAEFSAPLVPTASWGYVRLHRLDYDDAAIAGWSAKIAAQPWGDAYVVMKHDEGIGSGPPAVDAFIKACGA
ncbi:MAG: hypothetical protein JWM95_238 [Gemmatimonadetes bacterium]|nr:hypothetical protein [Gemmatimonadota bacterium]